MRAGTLRHTITLERPSGQRDETGERTGAFDPIATDVAAWVQPQRGTERFIRGQIVAGVTHVISLRFADYLKDMDATWRVIYQGRVLILAAPPIDVDERHQEFELNCIEGERQQ